MVYASAPKVYFIEPILALHAKMRTAHLYHCLADRKHTSLYQLQSGASCFRCRQLAIANIFTRLLLVRCPSMQSFLAFFPYTNIFYTNPKFMADHNKHNTVLGRHATRVSLSTTFPQIQSMLHRLHSAKQH